MMLSGRFAPVLTQRRHSCIAANYLSFDRLVGAGEQSRRNSERPPNDSLIHSTPKQSVKPTVSQTDGQGSVWRIWKEVCANTNANGEHLVTSAGYVNSRIVERMDSQIRKHDPLLNLDFRVSDTV
jgi:hypothetical protein